MPKDWDAILRGIPTPPDSDEEDGTNLVNVKRNARRNMELAYQLMPKALSSQLTEAPPTRISPPMYMNRPDALRDALEAVAAQVREASPEEAEAAARVAADRVVDAASRDKARQALRTSPPVKRSAGEEGSG